MAPPVRARATTRSDGAAVSLSLSPQGRAFRRKIHETIRRITDDLERDFHFNAAIAAIMELTNELYAFEASSIDGMAAAERIALRREAVETILLLLGPFCPHMTEELRERLGHRTSLFRQRWPEADAAALLKEEVTVVVQVDGRVRGRLTLDVDASEAEVERRALDDSRIRPWLADRRVERVVVVPNRLVNIVTRS